MSREQDEALVAKMARVDRALVKVIELNGGIVNGMARRVVADASLVEEVAQDVFVALWRRPGAFDPVRGSLKSFLATLARNKTVDLVRREESLRRTEDVLLVKFPTSPSSSEFVDAVGSRWELDDALARIPALQRQVITLAYFRGRLP